jgi:hypothetical protein
VQVCDELGDGSFGWVEEGAIRRCGHALVADGRVYLVDPFDVEGLDERVRAAGEPAGVIQLLDRHNRDAGELARRLAVPLHYLQAPPPFETVRLATPPRWNEVALWWPERRVLVAGDALGTVDGYFRARGDRLGVHPLLRLFPPRRLAHLAPEHVLVGHGDGVHADATAAMREALETARSRIPALLLGLSRAAAARRSTASR